MRAHDAAIYMVDSEVVLSGPISKPDQSGINTSCRLEVEFKIFEYQIDFDAPEKKIVKAYNQPLSPMEIDAISTKFIKTLFERVKDVSK